MPLLSMDALIGRRAVLRRVMRVLRGHPQAIAVHGRKAGVLLWGMGGVGKSALAGRVIARLLEDGWTAVAVVGRWSLGELATRVGAQLLGHHSAALDRLGDILLRQELPDEVRLVKLQELLAGHRVLLVLDNFEDNLVVGGGDFLDSTIESVLLMLMRVAQRGKLLVTSRYPVPMGREWLVEEPLGPLSLTETRKLFYRLPSLANAAPETLGLVLRHIGGHPRLLEYLDALLHQGTARLPEVTRRLRAQAQELGLTPEQLSGDLEQSMRNSLWLGAEDILLDQLLDIIQAIPEASETLFQASVFALPVPIQGLAGALVGSSEPTPAQIEAMQQTIRPLIDSSLLTPLDNGRVWVHRWTAQHLKTHMGDATFRACCQRAGEYLLVSRSLRDAVEAVRCFLEAQAFDRATDVAGAILDFMGRYGQLADVAAFAAEVLVALPPVHARYAHLCMYEADALRQLGATRKAFERYQEAMTILKSRVEAEPDRADYQRDLSVSYNKLGDLLQALGQGEAARQYYQQTLEIRQRLVAAEPDRADYQWDLVVSLLRMAAVEPDNSTEHRTRALAILRDLHATDRLFPEQEHWMRELEQELRTED
jgi:tetratricopeptide (TPR) repeat protein